VFLETYFSRGISVVDTVDTKLQDVEYLTQDKQDGLCSSH
jgi:hypothetical protein